MMIPVHRPFLGEEELRAIARIFDSRWLGMGAATKEFEDRLREFLGARHVIAVSSGSAALHVALHSLDLRPGDEVIVPSLTFVASVQAIVVVGATPVFCEIRADTLNMDIADALGRISSRTRAIMPVHYAGLACDMDALLPAARERGIRVVEDAAHAFGSTYRNRPVGALGDVTCFSFDAIKNITCGGGGAVATDDDEIASRIIARSNLGIGLDSWSRRDTESHWQYEVAQPGFRYHMNNLNAAIGIAQLTRVSEFRARKQAIVQRYDNAFEDVPGLRLVRRDLEQTFPFSYVVRVRDGKRDALMAHLKNLGIGATIQFIPNHLQPLFAPFRTSLPITERVYQELVTLPLYFELTDAQVDHVIHAVFSFFGSPS